MDLNVRKLSKGTIIFKQGDAAVCMYNILSGSVGIYVNYGEANEKQLTVLEAGSVFGEMGLIDATVRSATAVAASEYTELESVSPEDFDAYVQAHPEKAMQIMRGMSARIRALTKDYIEACGAIHEMTQNAAPEKKSSLKARFKRFLEDYEKVSAEYERYSDLYDRHYGSMNPW